MALQGKRVLYISYNGMLDPLGQTQVIPYLRELARLGCQFTLLSFERPAAFESGGAEKLRELQRQLAAENIEWHWLRYHKKPSLPATAYDVMAGIRLGRRLVRQNRIEMVHARAHIPATIALSLKKQFDIKMIFDIRGLMAEEYVDAEHWKKGGIPYRLTKTIERRALAAADGVVTLTERIWPIIADWDGVRGRDVIREVVPCCTDLQLFRFSADDRERRRAECGLRDRFTVVYSGSIDGWYLTEKMADFFVQLLRRNSSAHFLWLTPGNRDRIGRMMQERNIGPSSYTVRSVSSSEVPSYLSAGDVGLSFIKPCFSKIASSPTKNAEYLACGLPVIINAGIGDSDTLVTEEGLGALVNEFVETEYAKAISIIEDLACDTETTRKRAREAAERLFDVRQCGIERYARLYERVLVA
jgi:glycosyltransferase involved in cell wall biosynthesis